MGSEVSELRRKFRLLETYVPEFSVLALAEQLGRTEKTAWDWADKSDGKDANTIPERNFPPVLKFIEDSLEGRIDRGRVRALFLGPASQLENALRADDNPSLRNVISSEAIRGDWEMMFDEGIDRSLIETLASDIQDDNQAPSIPLDTPFQLRLKRDLRSFDVLALQDASTAWGPVQSITLDKTGHVQLPGLDKAGAAAWMRERTHPGLHEFSILATKKPFPAHLLAFWQEGLALDRVALASLADFFKAQPKAERRCFAYKIQIDRA